MMNLSQPTQAPAISVPTVSSSAMLVELSIGTWSGRKKDKRATAQVEHDNKTAKGVANVTKKLLGDCAELDAVNKFVANVRSMNYAATVPWSDIGLRLLPTSRYFKYHEQMTGLRDEFFTKRDAFLGVYDWERTQAQLKLGDLFNPDEYPTADKIKEAFRFNINYMPLPETGDWRVEMEASTVKTLKDHYEGFYSNQVESAMQDVWKRTYEALSKMSEGLARYGTKNDKGNKQTFRDSLVENVIEVTDLLSDFNINNSVQMTEMKTRLEDMLRGVTPDALREDDYLRGETQRQVNEIIKHLPTLDI